MPRTLPAWIASVAATWLLLGCAAERAGAPETPDAAPPPLVARGVGPTPLAASVDARRALAGALSRVVGEAPQEWWSYVGVMRREGFPTAVAGDLLNLDRFDAAADELGINVTPLPSRGGSARAEARLDLSRLLAAYDAEIDRADQGIARLSAENGVWSNESWAAVERLIADIKAGREYFVTARRRAQSGFSAP